MTRVLAWLFFGLVVIQTAAAQDSVPTSPTQCLTLDDSFSELYDIFALAFAILGNLLIPYVLSWSFLASRFWLLAHPTKRWGVASALFSAVHLCLWWLPPALAGSGLLPDRSWGLAFFPRVGQAYLACNPSEFGPKRGFLFGFWKPGDDLAIAYSVQMLVVFAVFWILTATLYWFIAWMWRKYQSGLEAMAR